MANNRPTWDQYFLQIAVQAAARSTCPRAEVGAVLVYKGEILSTGFNGAPAGKRHCTEVGCLLYHNHCIRTVHAEMNALLRAGKTSETILYATHSPCWECAKAIINANVQRIYYLTPFVDDRSAVWGVTTEEYLQASGIWSTQLALPVSSPPEGAHR